MQIKLNVLTKFFLGKYASVQICSSDHREDQTKFFETLTSKIFKNFNPLTPAAQKVTDDVFFDVSKVNESSFSKSDLTDPPQIFDAHLLENNNLSPSSSLFQWVFIPRSCFELDGLIAYSNE